MTCLILRAPGALLGPGERLQWCGSVCLRCVIPVSFAPLSSALVSRELLIFVVSSVFPAQPGFSFGFASFSDDGGSSAPLPVNYSLQGRSESPAEAVCRCRSGEKPTRCHGLLVMHVEEEPTPLHLLKLHPFH